MANCCCGSKMDYDADALQVLGALVKAGHVSKAIVGRMIESGLGHCVSADHNDADWRDNGIVTHPMDSRLWWQGEDTDIARSRAYFVKGEKYDGVVNTDGYTEDEYYTALAHHTFGKALKW